MTQPHADAVIATALSEPFETFEMKPTTLVLSLYIYETMTLDAL
jgi:hypothetical protein